jgi:hypothetical protein
VVRPAARKQLAGYLQQSYAISERRASQLVRIRRKALHYQAMRPASRSDCAAAGARRTVSALWLFAVAQPAPR